MLHHRLFGKSIVAILLGLPLFVGTSRARADDAVFVRLASALYEMRESKAELKDERFTRHRERAIKELDDAIEETEKALRVAKIELRRHELPKDVKEYYKAYKDCPHLRHAIVELREAKKEMEREKRGDFVRAIKAIDSAIVCVEEALRSER